MAYADTGDVDTVRTQLQTYVDSVTNTLLNARAQLALELHCDALASYITINQAANQSASSGLGPSFSKRDLAKARAAVDETLNELAAICALGDVTVPTIQEDGIAYWDIG